MSKNFKKSRTACAFVIAISLITPSANAASLQSVRLAAALPVLPSVMMEGEQMFLAEHRRDRRARRHSDRGRRHSDRVRRHPDDIHLRRDGDRRRIYRDRHGRYVDHVHDRPRYRQGYRGSRDRRDGYRRDNDGWWFPLAAFAIGAAIIAQQNRNQGYSQTYNNWNHIPAGNMNAHDNWCDRQYRSYNRSSKTFQPYNGPRKYCNSPYDLL